MMYLVNIVTHMQMNWNFQLCLHLTYVATAETLVMICWVVAEIWTYRIVDQLVALNVVAEWQTIEISIEGVAG